MYYWHYRKSSDFSVAIKIYCDYDSLMNGRPKKPPDEARSTYVRIRVTPAERAEIRQRGKASKTETAWIRQRLLGAE